MASKLSTTVETTQEVSLKPAIQKKLRTSLTEIANLSSTIKEMQAELDAQKAIVEAIRAETGLTSFNYEGYTVTEVRGTTTYVDIQWLIDEGIVSPSQKEMATKVKPKKPYTLVTCPKEK